MGSSMDKILKVYYEFILTPNPSKLWKTLRFLLHWVTLPIKFISMMSLGFYQIIKPKKIRAPLNINSPILTKKRYFKEAFDALPILKTTELESYVNRVPYYTYPNGYNHSPKDHCFNHSIYYFLMKKLSLDDPKMEVATRMFMQNKWLCEGFTWNPYENKIDYHANTTSSKTLSGLNLAIMAQDETSEPFDHLVSNIIENDYALIEASAPKKNSYGYNLYNNLLKTNMYRPEKVKMKSFNAMMQPGIELTGTKALTILATLRLAQIKNGNREAGKNYKKLLYNYGYGILSLFPVINLKFNYENHHECLISLYILSKYSKTKLGKLFWKIPMIYVWALSKHWYNGYFTGLVKDAYPKSINDNYINKCKDYLYEMKPNTYVETSGTIKITNQPVSYNKNIHEEFSCEVPYNYEIVEGNPDYSMKLKTGLGYIASAIMLETSPKELL